MIQIKKSAGRGETWTVTFRGLTLGQLLALRNGLAVRADAGSPVAGELLAFLDAAAGEDLLRRMSR